MWNKRTFYTELFSNSQFGFLCSFFHVSFFYATSLSVFYTLYLFPRKQWQEIRKNKCSWKKLFLLKLWYYFSCLFSEARISFKIASIVVTHEIKLMQIFAPVMWLNSIITPLWTLPNNQPKIYSALCLIQNI